MNNPRNAILITNFGGRWRATIARSLLSLLLLAIILWFAVSGALAANPSEPTYAAVSTIEVALVKTLADGQVATVLAGVEVNYVIRVENKGTSPIQSVMIVDRFPEDTSFSPSSLNVGWTLATDGRSATRTVGPLQRGQILEVTIVLRVDDDATATTLLNSAEIIEIRDETGQTTGEHNPPSGSSESLAVDNIDDEPIAVVVPTTIGLVSLTAQRLGAAVQVSWQTAFELNTVGYHIYRSAMGNFADAANVTNQIILGQGTSGGSYQYVDATAVSGAVYHYWLVAVEVSGASNMYGPVWVRLLSQDNPNVVARTVFLPVISLQ